MMGEYNGNGRRRRRRRRLRSRDEMEAAAAGGRLRHRSRGARGERHGRRVTRIRQEAAKRVATAERERDRAKEQLPAWRWRR